MAAAAADIGLLSQTIHERASGQKPVWKCVENESKKPSIRLVHAHQTKVTIASPTTCATTFELQ